MQSLDLSISASVSPAGVSYWVWKRYGSEVFWSCSFGGRSGSGRRMVSGSRSRFRSLSIWKSCMWSRLYVSTSKFSRLALRCIVTTYSRSLASGNRYSSTRKQQLCSCLTALRCIIHFALLLLLLLSACNIYCRMTGRFRAHVPLQKAVWFINDQMVMSWGSEGRYRPAGMYRQSTLTPQKLGSAMAKLLIPELLSTGLSSHIHVKQTYFLKKILHFHWKPRIKQCSVCVCVCVCVRVRVCVCEGEEANECVLRFRWNVTKTLQTGVG